MSSAFDQRIVQVGLTLEDGITTFQDLSIMATGTKFGSPTAGICEARIFNLTREQRNYILKQASLIGREKAGPGNLREGLTPIKMTLDVGRESYGVFRLFEGYVFSCLSAQPPDIGISLRSLTNNAKMSLILGATQSSIAPFRKICQQVADLNGVQLNFQAKDISIDNFTFSGAAAKMVNKIEECGNYEAFIDNGTLVVKDAGIPLEGEARLINEDNGMVGIPEITAWGVSVRVMIDNSIRLGHAVKVESIFNPGANGTYYVYKMDYQVANRANPFWYVLECRAYLLPGAQAVV